MTAITENVEVVKHSEFKGQVETQVKIGFRKKSNREEAEKE